MRDLDGDGTCELIVGNSRGNAYCGGTAGTSGRSCRFKLPKRTTIVDDQGRDAGLRFIDVDEDGHLDVLFSNDERYSLHLVRLDGKRLVARGRDRQARPTAEDAAARFRRS